MKSFEDDYNNWARKNNKVQNTEGISNVKNNSSASTKSFEDDYSNWRKKREEEERRKREEEKRKREEEQRKREEEQKRRKTETKQANKQQNNGTNENKKVSDNVDNTAINYPKLLEAKEIAKLEPEEIDAYKSSLFTPNVKLDSPTSTNEMVLPKASDNILQTQFQQLTPEKQKQIIEADYGEPYEIKVPKSNIGAIGSNLFLGLKKGVMNFSEAATSEINKTFENRNKDADYLRDKVGLPSSEESKKIILGDNYNKDLFGRDTEEQQKKWDNKKRQIDLQMAINSEYTNGPISKKLSELAPDIGKQLPGIALPGPLSALYFAGSAKTDYMEDAKARGMTEKDADTYSGIMALAELVPDLLGAKFLKSGVKGLAKGSTKEALKDYGSGILENFVEEAVMEPISETTATLTGGKETANWKNMWNRMLRSGLDGVYSSILMEGTSAGVGKAIQVTNKINNNQQVSMKEMSEAINETLESGAINQEELKAKIKQNTNNIIQEEINNNEQLPVVSEQNIYSEKLKETATEEINNSSEEQIKQASQNFSKQIDAVKNGTFPKKDMLVLGNTPQALKDIGLPDLPITRTQKHLDTIMNETGKYKGANYHNLGEEIIKQLPEAINNPLDIVKSNTKDDSVVLTTYLADKENRTVIASIKIDGKGRVNDIIIDTNVMTSAYGRNNYDAFMEKNLKEDNILYDIDRGVIKKATEARLQLPRVSNFSTSGRLQLPTSGNTINNSITPQNENVNYTNNYAPKAQNDTQNNLNTAPTADNVLATGEYTRKKTLNPTEIANINKESMNTTPKLETKNYKAGNKQSNFVSNILNDAQFLNKDLRQEMGKDENIRYYNGITNAETLEKAYNSLKEGGEKETLNWFSKNEKNTTAEDVTKGWILLKQYQDAGDYQGAVEVAKKMRQIGTNAGQAVQAYNILSRLTPEGMFYYAQSELSEAYNKMVEGKSKQWIENNQDKFTLSPEETQTIIDTMKEISNMEDGREKTVKLAQIQKMVSDKIPPSAGQSVKAWMRISMLFNPKTQVRNVLGNAVVLPVNTTADVFSGAIDKLVSKKTGVRTTGITKEGIKGYTKGFGKGLFESYDDFRKGINTRNVEGNRFEINEGKSFKDKGIGKALNRVDNILSFSLDAGDRGFYEASFTNSINNQLVLNNTTEVTQDMIDIATNEALQRTWQDDNAYTTSVLQIRKILNKANVKGYGLGDVLIPFAKTPANLTKAIVDYSPVGLAKTLTLDAKKFNNSLNNGQYSTQLQHKFVQNLGKGMAGSLLYALGYGLAKAGIATGEADDDKDVKNFMKNSLGISSYSLKIGDKSFTYDWAQPVATPLAIMTNYVKYSKDNPDATAIDKAIKSLDIGTEQLLQQSFMESLNTVLNGSGTTMENLSQAVLDLPARAVPTFSKQIADMVDSTQRTSFEYGKPVQSAINSVVSKIPFASKSLPASVDTLGNEIKKYGGKNNLWNVMFNPANMNKGQLSKAGEEIYNLYMQTGDTTIFPRTAPYYINSSGEKITMTSGQRNNFQSVEGKYVNKAIEALLKDNDYKKLSDDDKTEIINQIVSDSYSKAKYDILKIDSKEYEKTRTVLKTVSPASYYNYKFKTKDLEKSKDKIEVIVNSKYSNEEKASLYETYVKAKDDKKYEIIKSSYTSSDKLNIDKYLKYKLAEANGEFNSDRKDDGTEKGKAIYGTAKTKRWEYIENMDITYTQKLLLYGMEYTASDNQQRQIINYINTLPGKSKDEKLEMLKQFKGFTVYKNGSFKY